MNKSVIKNVIYLLSKANLVYYKGAKSYDTKKKLNGGIYERKSFPYLRV